MENPEHRLALLGGTPTFPHKLHVGRPNIGDRKKLLERLDTILDTRWLSNGGPFVQQFEEHIATTVGVKHCIAMCNATVALEIAIRALDLEGEVIVPAFSFIATAHALQWQQVSPIFCDIDPATHNIDPASVERSITSRTTGILGVHLWGRPCAIRELQEIADRYKLKLLFDAAHAFGCRYGDKNIGSFGDAEVFSFHATKFVNAGEGGAVVTNDDALAHRIRLMKNFGFSGYDKVVYIGTNGKMNELSAALGLTNLESIAEFTAVNKRNLAVYRSSLEGIPGIALIEYDEATAPNFQYLVLEVDSGKLGLSRDELMAVLHAENVLARRYFYPGIHRMEPYSSKLPDARGMLPHTESLVDRILHLPTGTGVTASDIAAICRVIRTAIEFKSEIREACRAA